MQEFWATVFVYKSSIRFTINKKIVSLDVDIFREILQFCLKIPGQKFEDLPLEQDIISFIRDLGHTSDITYLTDVNVDYLHQSWRTFVTVINKCLSGKETGIDKIREKTPKPKYIRKKAKPNTSSPRKACQDYSKVPDCNLKLNNLVDDEDKDGERRDKGDDDNDGNNGNDGGDDDANDDDKQEGDDTNDDDEETDSDITEPVIIKIPILDQSTTEFYEEEEEENIDDEETMYDDEDDEVTKELYDDVNVNLGNKDAEMTNADQANNKIASLMVTSAHHAIVIPENTSVFTITIPPTTLFFNPLLQQATPTLTPTTSEATTSFPALPDFASVFKFNERVFNLEKDVSKIKQVDQYAQALSSIPTIVDRYMDKKLGKAINKAILAHNLDCRQDVQDEKNAYIELIDTSMRALIKEEVNTQIHQSLTQTVSDFANPVIEKNVTKSVEAVLLTRSSSKPMSTYEAAASLSEFELTKILIDKIGVEMKTKIETPPLDQTEGRKERNQVKLLSPPEIQVMNPLKIPNLTQEILVGPAFNLLKGTCKSITELEYHIKECSKATTERLDWHNPKNKPYLFDLRKPLPLIQDHQGCQIIPQDYFLNKDLEYLQGGELSRRYSTSVTKTKAATYDLKWIEDLGLKQQRFYGYASNLTSSKDVYSRRRIIAVTRLEIMKMYDYGHLEVIEVRQDDQKLYMFKEGDFKRLHLQDIESNLRKRTAYTAYSDPKGVIYKDQMNKNRLIRADEPHKFSDGTLDDVRSALNDIAKGIRMEYLPMRKWCNLDKKRARVMVQDIDNQLYQRRLMRNLEKFIGGREYGIDLRLLERTI
ncbi:hypothetical protein Tco_0005621 [Tanacetum coccineum]